LGHLMTLCDKIKCMMHPTLSVPANQTATQNIDAVIKNHAAAMADIRQRHAKVMREFFEFLQQKKMNNLKRTLETLS